MREKVATLCVNDGKVPYFFLAKACMVAEKVFLSNLKSISHEWKLCQYFISSSMRKWPDNKGLCEKTVPRVVALNTPSREHYANVVVDKCKSMPGILVAEMKGWVDSISVFFHFHV